MKCTSLALLALATAPGLADVDMPASAPDFEAQAAVEHELLAVPVRKPHKQQFIRVRPGEEWSKSLNLLPCRGWLPKDMDDLRAFVLLPHGLQSAGPANPTYC